MVPGTWPKSGWHRRWWHLGRSEQKWGTDASSLRRVNATRFQDAMSPGALTRSWVEGFQVQVETKQSPRAKSDLAGDQRAQNRPSRSANSRQSDEQQKSFWMMQTGRYSTYDLGTKPGSSCSKPKWSATLLTTASARSIRASATPNRTGTFLRYRGWEGPDADRQAGRRILGKLGLRRGLAVFVSIDVGAAGPLCTWHWTPLQWSGRVR